MTITDNVPSPAGRNRLPGQGPRTVDRRRLHHSTRWLSLGVSHVRLRATHLGTRAGQQSSSTRPSPVGHLWRHPMPARQCPGSRRLPFRFAAEAVHQQYGLLSIKVPAQYAGSAPCHCTWGWAQPMHPLTPTPMPTPRRAALCCPASPCRARPSLSKHVRGSIYLPPCPACGGLPATRRPHTTEL